MSVEVISNVAPAASRHNGPSGEHYHQYRALSSLAVTSSVLGMLGVANLLSYQYGLALGLVPLVGLIAGVRAWWIIRSNPQDYTGSVFAWVGMGLSLVYLLSGWGFAGFVYATEVPDNYLRIDYGMLQPEEDHPSQVIPPAAKQLNGQRVFIKGYVYPGPQEKGIKQFVLCRDNGDCCFGGNPKLTDRILVTLTDPLRLNYSQRIHRLAGTFRVQETEGVDGLQGVVYQLEADYLK